MKISTPTRLILKDSNNQQLKMKFKMKEERHKIVQHTKKVDNNMRIEHNLRNNLTVSGIKSITILYYVKRFPISAVCAYGASYRKPQSDRTKTNTKNLTVNLQE